MASNFNSDHGPNADPVDGPGIPPDADAAVTPDPSSEAASPSSAAVVSEAMAKFRSCRWQQPAESGSAEFCTHREVKPFAGTAGFDPDAWCLDCKYYKLRRIPKKRPDRDEYSY